MLYPTQKYRNVHELEVLVKREMVESIFKFMFISIVYPIVQVGIYATTGDITALSFAFVLVLLWLVTLYCFIQLFKKPDDSEKSIEEDLEG